MAMQPPLLYIQSPVLGDKCIHVLLALFIWLSTPGDGSTHVLNVFYQYLRVMLYSTLDTW